VVVESDRGGDHLLDPAGELAADLAVAGHQVGALLEVEGVPVHRLAAALAHRVETDVLAVGHVGVELRLDVATQPLVGLLGVVLEVVGRDVAADLRDRDVGARALGELRERRRLEPSLGGREVIERRAEVDEHEVGLLPEDRADRRDALVGVGDGLVRLEVVDALRDGPVAGVLGGRPPGVPVDAPEIVQDEPALVGLWRLGHTHRFALPRLGPYESAARAPPADGSVE
jgi:hypothetical protein